MNNDYIITQDELALKGISLSDYCLDGTYIPAIVNIALDMAITRVLYFNDNFVYEEDIETAIDNEPRLVKPFKKLQYQVIYNLLFLGDNDPINVLVDNIICQDLKWGKINGYQKNVWVR